EPVGPAPLVVREGPLEPGERDGRRVEPEPPDVRFAFREREPPGDGPAAAPVDERVPGAHTLSILSRRLLGLRSVQTSSTKARRSAFAPDLPASRHPAGASRSAGQREYCSSWLSSTLYTWLSSEDSDIAVSGLSRSRPPGCGFCRRPILSGLTGRSKRVGMPSRHVAFASALITLSARLLSFLSVSASS